MQRKNLFREYASKIYSGEIESEALAGLSSEIDNQDEEDVVNAIASLQIDDQTMEGFRSFATKSGLVFSDQDWSASRRVTANFLKQELLLLVVGDEASYRAMQPWRSTLLWRWAHSSCRGVPLSGSGRGILPRPCPTSEKRRQ